MQNTSNCCYINYNKSNLLKLAKCTMIVVSFEETAFNLTSQYYLHYQNTNYETFQETI